MEGSVEESETSDRHVIYTSFSTIAYLQFIEFLFSNVSLR